MKKALTHFKHYTESLFLSYSSLLFTSNKYFGFLLFLVTLMQPQLALSGIISWLTTFIFTKLIGLRKDDFLYPVYAYNSLLVGFAIGIIYKVTLLSILFTIAASVITVLLSYSLQTVLWNFFKLPVLNVPFTIVGIITYLASARYSSLVVNSFASLTKLNFDFLPLLLQGLLKSVGILLFLPYDLVGLIILIGVFFNSRIRFFLIIFSYYVGVLVLSLFKGSLPAAAMDYSAFNFILIGVALGGSFFIPSRRTYVLIGTAVMSSVIVLDAVSVFFSSFGIPVFTLPFSVVVLLFVYVLGSIKYKYMNLGFLGTPEIILTQYLNFQSRFDRNTPQPCLPFRGTWSVYQPMNGEWTHKGIWKNAVDFVISDEDGITYRNEGNDLKDYFCYDKPIIAPVNGTIVDVIKSMPDNPIGKPDHSHSWGNYVILRSDYGYFVELSHFKCESIKVNIGDYVKVGQILGNCGNSGNSAQPHLHMQVQKIGFLGAAAEFFYFSSAKNNSHQILNNRIIEKDEKLLSVTKSKKFEQMFHFALDDKLKFIVNDNPEDLVTFTVKMDDAGAFYLAEGQNKLYYGLEADSFVFYSYEGKTGSYLANLMKAMPRIYFAKDELKWEEALPFNLFRFFGIWKVFFASFNHKLSTSKGNYYQSEDLLRAEVNVGREKFNSNVRIDVGDKLRSIEYSCNGRKTKLELSNEK
jgi:urea transporter/murein DD-endopeptidase MepM/ murein hydrolase activator NlpD